MGKQCYGQVTETGSKQLGPSQLPCPSVFFPSQHPHSTCIQTQLYLLPLLECSFTGSFSTAYPPSCAHSHLQWFAQTPTCQRNQSCTIITSSSNHSSTAAFLCPPCTFFPKASICHFFSLTLKLLDLPFSCKKSVFVSLLSYILPSTMLTPLPLSVARSSLPPYIPLQEVS